MRISKLFLLFSFIFIIVVVTACSSSPDDLAPTVTETKPAPSPTVLPPTVTTEPTPKPTNTPEITADEYLYIEVMKQIVQKISDWTKVYALHWQEFDNSDKWQDLRTNYQNNIRDNCKIAEEFDVPDKFADKHEELLLSCTEIELGFNMIGLNFLLEDEDSLGNSLDIVTKGVEDLKPYADWLFQ